MATRPTITSSSAAAACKFKFSRGSGSLHHHQLIISPPSRTGGILHQFPFPPPPPLSGLSSSSSSSSRRWSSSSSSSSSSSFAQHLKPEMTARALPPLLDPCSGLNSSLLARTLDEFFPPAPRASSSLLLPLSMPTPTPTPMPFAHHLVYFPPPLPLSSLQPDGTDPLHSPGPPFTRRMWAGGRIKYSDDFALALNGAPAVCRERITDVMIRGREGGEEAVVVRIERWARHYGQWDEEVIDSERSFGSKKEGLEGRHYDYDEAEARDPIEVRNLIFLRESLRKPSPDKLFHHPKFIKPPETPDFSHRLVPSAALLFRFSALTFNAHAIHLDKHYCQEIEGHRNLLVHGPLTVILMVELLRRHLENNQVGRGRLPKFTPKIESTEYRNLAPLYAEEEMKICGKKKMGGEYEMWIEGKEGGLAVRGTVRTKEDFS